MLCVVAVFSCLTLSSCSTAICGFSITSNGTVLTELKNKNQCVGEVTIPSGFTRIADEAFIRADGITKIIIPEGITHIGARAFADCESLEEVVLPSTLRSLGEDAFAGCPKVKLNVGPASDDGITLYYLGTSDNDYFALVGADVPTEDTVEDRVYEYNVSDSTVVIADGALAAADDAVAYSCEAYLPESVRYIGESAFEGIAGLKKVVMTSSVESVGFSAFKDCDALEEITLPFAGGTRDDNTFLGYIFGARMHTFNKWQVPGTLAKLTLTTDAPISDYAFSGCDSLKQVIVHEGTASIGFGAFKNCDSIELMHLPFIGASGDGKENSHLGYIFGATDPEHNGTYVPETLTELHITGNAVISKGALSSLSHIERLYLYDKVERVAEGAFDGCVFGYNGLGGAHYLGSPDSPYLVLMELKNKSVREFDIDPSVKVIADGAFADCAQLASIVIPDGVITVGADAFRGCTALKTVEMYGSVSSIYDNAFNDCTKISKFTFRSTRDRWNEIYIGIGNDVIKKKVSFKR